MQIVRNIPNFLTLINLFLGCLAIIYISSGKLQYAAFMVFAAAAIDFLDGFVARALNAVSSIGAELDSLADMVTFGVVPGYMLYYLIAASYQQQPDAIGYPALAFLPGFLFTVVGAVRLARFNVLFKDQTDFVGLPIPAAAIFVATLPLIMLTDQLALSGILLNTYVLYGITIIFSILMVANLPMFSLKVSTIRWEGNKKRISFIAVAAVLIFIFAYAGIAFSILLYIIFSLLDNFFTKKSKPH